MTKRGFEEVVKASLVMLAGCAVVALVGGPMMRWVLIQVLW